MMNEKQMAAPAGRVDVTAAAAHLGYSASWLNKSRAEGRGPRYIRAGGRIFYRIADLDAYIDGCVVETEDSREQAA